MADGRAKGGRRVSPADTGDATRIMASARRILIAIEDRASTSRSGHLEVSSLSYSCARWRHDFRSLEASRPSSGRCPATFAWLRSPGMRHDPRHVPAGDLRADASSAGCCRCGCACRLHLGTATRGATRLQEPGLDAHRGWRAGINRGALSERERHRVRRATFKGIDSAGMDRSREPGRSRLLSAVAGIGSKLLSRL